MFDLIIKDAGADFKCDRTLDRHTMLDTFLFAPIDGQTTPIPTGPCSFMNCRHPKLPRVVANTGRLRIMSGSAL
jgi:hypothetical protein